MKKISIIMAVFLFSITAYSQWNLPLDANSAGSSLQSAIKNYNEDPSKENKKKLKFAIDLAFTAGGNYSGIVGESESYNGFLPGAVLGAHMNITRPDRKLTGDAGLLFSMEGARYKEYDYEPGGSGSESSASLRLNYLRIPVTAKYRNNINKGFYAEAGLQPGILLTAKDKRNGSSNNVKEGFKKFDLGIVLGVGYQFSHKLGAELKAIPGITNINKSETTYGTSKDRNLNFSLRASYRLF